MKHWIFRILQPSSRNGPGRLFDAAILVLTSASVFAVFAETFDLSPVAVRVFAAVEIAASLVFTAEYALRVWTADLLHPRLPPWRARLRYIHSGMAIVDLLSFLPFWLPMLLPTHLLGLRAIHLLCLLRILKLNRYLTAISAIVAVFRRKSRELVASCILIGLLMLLSSLLMYHAEHDAQPDAFPNAFAGLWWAAATFTTIGYGDIYPVTVAGRLLGALIAFLGIGMVAIPTGILGSGFVEHFSRSSKNPPAPLRCPHCGKELPRP
jgi:voltage-gated potassium channel